MEWKHIESQVKEEFQVHESVKKVMLAVFWDMKGPLAIDFFKKGATVNSTSYCQLIKQNFSYL